MALIVVGFPVLGFNAAKAAAMSMGIWVEEVEVAVFTLVPDIVDAADKDVEDMGDDDECMVVRGVAAMSVNCGGDGS
eukprot:7362986-Ditylum_brightwellii.AAC.1